MLSVGIRHCTLSSNIRLVTSCIKHVSFSSSSITLSPSTTTNPHAAAAALSSNDDAIYSSSMCEALRFASHGSPSNTLSLDTCSVTGGGQGEPIPPENERVYVRMLAAPVNPSDLNAIEGTYPCLPSHLPGVGGNEGVGKVISVGKDVVGLVPGDKVIPALSGWGTWRTYAMCGASELTKIPDSMPLELAATISVNPSTAIRLLSDFVDLVPGDTVIQNGANSGVGKAVIQIAKAKGIRTVNVIRDRDEPELEKLREYLKGLGASHVVTESFMRTPEMRQLMKEMKPPRLGLNCVGGSSGTELLRLLSPESATCVTYGGMSRKPVIIPTGLLIFNDLRVVGYWQSRWSEQHQGKEREAMFDELNTLALSGQFRVDVDHFPLKEWRLAIDRATDRDPKRADERKPLLTFT